VCIRAVQEHTATVLRSETIPQSGQRLPISQMGEQVMTQDHHHRWYAPVSRKKKFIKRGKKKIDERWTHSQF
jgi:hypothetical protein